MSELPEEIEPLGRRDRMLSCFKESSAFMLAVNSLPESLHLKDEADLGKMFNITPLDYAMKKRLWTRFYEVEETGDMRLKMRDIFGGLCSDPYFYRVLVKNPVRIAWLTAPPIDTEFLLEEAFRFAFEKVRDGILNMPVTEKSAPTILKAFQYFADRHLGPMIQKIESKNLNVEMNANQPLGSVDPHEIQKKLDELKTKLLKPKDVTPVGPDVD